MVARVLLVGNELLGGTVSDTNAAQVARALGPRGVPVAGVEIVGDDPASIAETVRRLAARCDVLVVTGGLGPTADDVTRHGMAMALGEELVEDPGARGVIEETLAARGIARPSDSVREQARFPRGTTAVRNPLGTAPGFTGRLGTCRFWALPGVPWEVAGMLPAVAAELPGEGDWERVVATAGIGETRLAQRLERAGYVPPRGIALGYLPSPGGVVLRLSAVSGPGDLDEAERRLRDRLGSWALPRPTLQESLVHDLNGNGATIATAESCTAGLIAARITDVPGASSVYCGGIVAYSDRIKISQLGVPRALLSEEGAVSEGVARSMAQGARERFEASFSLAVTGIAGPGGGSPDKPVGTVWIAVAGAEGVVARRFRFAGSRPMVRERTVNKALEMAYRRERGVPE